MKFPNILLVCLLFTLSCKKSDPPPIYHYEYFPMDQGRFVIYDVLDIVHDDAVGVHDTNQYQLKTTIGSIYIDNLNREAREFTRFKRNNPTEDWIISDVWTCIIDQNRLEIVEENQRIIRMVFPVNNTKLWNPYAFTTFDEEEFYYDNFHKARTIAGQIFDETVVVEEKDFNPFNAINRRFEVYAKNVGLVERYFKDFTIKNGDTLQPNKGFEQYYTVQSFGIE